MHTQASEEDLEEAHALMSKQYSSKAETFLLGMCTRLLSIVHNIPSMQGLTNFHLLRNWQDSR
jgi:hypothetical protein